MAVKLDSSTALIVTDIQIDFCPGGALPVPEGDAVIPVLNAYQEKVQAAGGVLVFTRDWHPANHSSFKKNGGIWPVHCVQNTPGAAFHPDLKFPTAAVLVSKATHPEKEAYSSFEGTELNWYLQRLQVKTLLVGGLATDYCVKNTVLDGLKLGFSVYFLEDASRGVDMQPGDSDRAIQEMLRAGARKMVLSELSV
jgi:nicotinamidase/pyrazinamidase